jgi:hypothetical protein
MMIEGRGDRVHFVNWRRDEGEFGAVSGDVKSFLITHHA